MRAGVGFAIGAGAFEVGFQAAGQAARRGGVAAADLVLAFCSGELDAEAFLGGVRAAVGAGAPVLGGSAIGVLTNDQLAYQGAPGAVAVLELGAPLRGVAAAGGIDRDEREAGRRLGRSLAGPGAEGAQALLLFYDCHHHRSR